ncbi:hypothetical protein [Halorubrum sp. DTA46]|uniref:hypothetical protein n=1 Tax=Halorubrum sp. DTA46 TaxID=3402162 RepID=UPI003AAE7329
MDLPLGFEPFAGQSRAAHAAVLVGGALACLLGYVGAAAVLFEPTALAHDAPAGSRRVAAAFASLACWGFYSAAFVRGKGGPVTNVVVSPLVTVTVLPFAYRWIVFGPAWDAIRDRVSLLYFRPSVFVDAAALVLPGLVFSAGLLTLWASLLGEEAVEKWQREHLSREFRRAFVDE